MSSTPNPADAARLVSQADEEAVKEMLGATVLDTADEAIRRRSRPAREMGGSPVTSTQRSNLCTGSICLKDRLP